jgi:glycosyltransferase involved in cell wall biosynthesis
VILPIYNGEAYLGEALDSILTQSLTDIQILIIDDGSTDGSADLVGHYVKKHPRICYVRQDNAGVSAARNTGIGLSEGQYIAFLDQDDRWSERALEIHVTELEANPDLGYTLSHQVCFLERGVEKPSWFSLQELDVPVVGYLPGCLVARQSLFKQLGVFNTRYPISSDADWFARAKDAEIKMRILPDVTLGRRIHGENQSRHSEVIQQELFHLLKASIARKNTKS